MLAFLGFLTIILILALIMSKKSSTLIALIIIPTITGLITAALTARETIISAAMKAAEESGTDFVEPAITFGKLFEQTFNSLTGWTGDGIKSIAATGVMFIFAILFFSTCSDAGVFDPIISKILKLTGNDPVKIAVGTFLIGCICHLDGSGATTFLIAIPACMPLYKKMKMNYWVEATIVSLAAGIMNVMPWGGPTIRAATAISGLGYDITPSQLWVGIMPSWIVGLIMGILCSVWLGRKESKRLAAGIAADKCEVEEVSSTDANKDLVRTGWRWYFNICLIIVLLIFLIKSWLSPAATFMIGFCILLIVNYPNVKQQHDIINSHAKSAFLMVSIVFAAGAFTGIMKGSGMLEAMTQALVSIIPTAVGRIMAPVVGFLSVPLSLLFDPDSFYYGVMPVIANAVAAMGGSAVAVAKASIMGQMTLGFPLSPLTGATFLLLGLAGQDLGDHQKHTLPYAWLISIVMVIVGCLLCGLLVAG